jgi:four helix bundle protein
MDRSSLRERSFSFSKLVIRVSQKLQIRDKDRILSKQFIRAATSVGAMIHEAQFAQSRVDFIHKLSISLKEANETKYWLELLEESGFLEFEEHQTLLKMLEEILYMLIASIRTAKNNERKNEM